MTIPDERLAEIAGGCVGVSPGPWETDDPWIVFSRVDGDIRYLATTADLDTDEPQSGVNAAHIARLDPETVLALVTELQSSRAEIAALREGLASAVRIADEAADEWDKAPEGMRAGKILLALAGRIYRADTDAIHALLEEGQHS